MPLTREQIEAIKRTLPWPVPQMKGALTAVTSEQIHALCDMALAHATMRDKLAEYAAEYGPPCPDHRLRALRRTELFRMLNDAALKAPDA